MQDGDAEFAVGVDVRVVEGAGELEGGRGVGVVGGEVHGGEEVAAVVEGVRVDDYEGDGPVEYVVVFELFDGEVVSFVVTRKEESGRLMIYLDVNPFLL